jgi:hypothetical protein
VQQSCRETVRRAGLFSGLFHLAGITIPKLRISIQE